jgi:putative inorganic carbon (HCO3(-)) transporter
MLETGDPRGRWLRGARSALVLAFCLCLLFFPDHPAAPGLLVSLALGAAAVALAVALLARDAAWPGGAGVRALVVGAWPYPLYVLCLTLSWALHPSDAAMREYGRQMCFLAVVFAVGQTARGATARWVAILVIGLALIVAQILGPHSVLDGLGRPLHYRSIQQWSGYPEIGLLASLGAVACLAFALADRRWRVRGAGALLAAGFAAATIYLLSRFSLITIVVTGGGLALVSAVRLRSRLAQVVLAACVIAALGLALWRADVSARLASVFVDRTAAMEIRSEGWRVARAMLHDHPLLGVGPGRYREEYPHYSTTGDRGHAYNIILHQGAELGYLGLAAYLALWARVLWRTLRAADRSPAGVAACATLGMLVAFFLRSQSEHFLANLDASFRLLLLLAFLFGLAEAASPERRNADSVVQIPPV